KWEMAYNHVDAFHRAKVLYGLALLASLVSLLFLRRWLRLAAMALLGAAAVIHLIGLGLRVGISGRPPVSNLFETFVFVAWVGAVLGLTLEAFNRRGFGLLVGAIM